MTKENWKSITRSFYKLDSSNFGVEVLSKKMFLADLHSISYKNIYFREELYEISGNRNEILLHQLSKISEYTKIIEKRKLINLIHRIRHDIRIPEILPNAVFFYTRPFNTLELTSLISNWSNSEKEIELLNSYLKLFLIPPINVVISEIEPKNEKLKHLKVNNVKKHINPTVALTSFYTDEKSWIAQVRNDEEEPDGSRFTRLFRLVNDILICQKKVDYVVFPELSLPRQLILYIANKLKAKKISLIAGIEYAKQGGEITENIKGSVSNQLLYVLNTNNGFYNEQVFIIQEKVIPAFHEERDLFDTGGLVLRADSELKFIIQHDKFSFSGLICNELLNIDYRQPLRGKIDALFVVEWNKDTEMYDPIVSSTSNDLHCFMVQVNNRKYGDTRLRGPYKESYNRDKVRVRGGELDYFVVATIDAKEIREFQRNHRSPEKPFKPIPSGFTMSEKRKRIDFGED
jgi:predicted amidohydrolase